jgi:hypothetical protein
MNSPTATYGVLVTAMQARPNYCEQYLLHSLAIFFIFLVVCMQTGASQSGKVKKTSPTPAAVCPSTLPTLVIDAGYCTHTLNSTFTTSTVDMDSTLGTQFQWYRKRFPALGGDIAPHVTLQADGSVVVQSNGRSNSDLATAAPAGKSWVGTAYGGGGYFEATMSFNPATLVRADVMHSHWPAWWADPIEADAQQWDRWRWNSTSAQYLHAVETDFFEYDAYEADNPKYFDPTGLTYGGTLHDWTQVADRSSGWGYSLAPGGHLHAANNSDKVPVGTDFTKPHRYGFLWIPATQTNCTNTVQYNSDGSLNLSSGNGVAVFFFDGVPFKTASLYGWCKYNNTTDTAADLLSGGVSNNWIFGVLDRQHLVLTFGSGGAAPLTVYSVQVWQKDVTGNVTNGQTVIPN